MSPEEIKKMQEENAALKADKSRLEGELATAKTTISDKDKIIETKNQDLVGIRKKYGVTKYRTLDELSDDERNAMSEVEIERKKEQDTIYEQQETDRQEREAERKRTIDERLSNAIKSRVGADPELAQKLRDNFGQIVGADAAFTDGEIGSFMDKAFNMLGDERPNPVREVSNAGGGIAPVLNGSSNEGAGFAESPQGQSLAKSLGISLPNV